MAKNVFNEIGATYKVIELDEHNDGRSLQEALAQMTGARTVRTQCFILGAEFLVTSQPIILAPDKKIFSTQGGLTACLFWHHCITVKLCWLDLWQVNLSERCVTGLQAKNMSLSYY